VFDRFFSNQQRGERGKGNLIAAKRHKERKKKTQKNLTQRRKGEDKTNRRWDGGGER
jgi:hypothetical protein